ncbi:hypothetical protein ACWEOP_26180 [Streptomyces chartreusis]
MSDDVNQYSRPDLAEESAPTPDVTGVPPKQYLPRPLHKLLAARDEAYDRWADADAEYAHLLTSGWEAMARAKDEAAGRAAVAAGRDPLAEPSALEEAQLKRPRALGALKALADAVRKADAVLVAAVRRELPAISALIEPDVTAAADEYVRLQREADAARQRYGAKVALRSWATDWFALNLRTDYLEHTEATPREASGAEPTDVYGKPVRGAEEVRIIDESYGRVRPRQTAVIRSTVNGQVMEIEASYAAAQVASRVAEYVTDDAPTADAS